MNLSVICPVYNEEVYIQDLIDYLVRVNPIQKEIIFIDGGSRDKTIEIIQNYSIQYSNIKLLHNPKKFVPFALNNAIIVCQSEYIVRIDAHSTYAPDYFEKILSTFQETNADIVGGPYRVGFHTPFQQAVGYAISTKLGVGDSKVHQQDYKGYTDSVAYGAWRRTIFEEVGLFDTRLLRNQDDEFHYRAKSRGKRIYQNPDIKLYYYPRSTPQGLFKQYFQYGLFKPRVLRKIQTEIKLRHLIPMFFVLYLVMLPLLTWVSALFVLPLLLYMLLITWVGLRHTAPLQVRLLTVLSYPIIHTGYGLGFLLGLFFQPERFMRL
jgi:glycosyltransferase involved in cell wall biosynthesis